MKLLVLDLMTRSPSFITLLPNRENFLQETFSQLHFNNIGWWEIKNDSFKIQACVGRSLQYCEGLLSV